MRALITILFFIAFFFFPGQSYAHVLQEDGSIGALLHIHPNDDPIAGEKSEFYLNFKDKQNKFSSNRCECSVTILKSGKQIFSQPLFHAGQGNPQTSASFTYTFPEKNIYAVRVDGKPLEPDAFQPFTLTFDVRVDYVIAQSSNSDSNDYSYLPYVIGGGFIGVGAVLLLVHKSKNARR